MYKLEDYTPGRQASYLVAAKMIRLRAAEIQTAADVLHGYALDLIETANDLEHDAGGRDLRGYRELFPIDQLGTIDMKHHTAEERRKSVEEPSAIDLEDKGEG